MRDSTHAILSARIYKTWRSVMRHRERYIRAWMAHYGAHPSLVQIVEFPKAAGDERGEVMRMEYRKDTDAVAELVEAAQLVRRLHPTPQTLRQEQALARLIEALKAFDPEPASSG